MRFLKKESLRKMNEQKLLSIGKAANILGVHIDTLREWDKEGKLKSIKTPGNHRRYRISDIEKFYKDNITYSTFLEIENSDRLRNKFLFWKRFVDAHYQNQEVANKSDELKKREGCEMVVQALESLSDEDWSSFDKIDEALEPVYDWYRKNHELSLETLFYNQPVTTSEKEKQERRYQTVLKKINMQQPTQLDLNEIHWMMDGIYCVLWSMDGIAPNGEKSVLEGNGSFLHQR